MNGRMRAPRGVYRFPVFSGNTRYFRASGEFRAPKKGEWYLSGAIIEACPAENDLMTEFWIAEEIPHPVKEIVRDGFRYTLAGVAR